MSVLSTRLANAAAMTATGTLLAASLVAIAPSATAAVIGPEAEFFTVSQSAAGAASQPFLTPDSQRVLYTSTASDLVSGDGNGFADVFVSVAIEGSDDPFSGAPSLVSRPDDSLADVLANGASGEPVASADGRYVAFSSAATNLVPGGTTAGRTHVYVRDTRLGTTFLAQGAAEPDGSSRAPDLSDDGRYLVFTSAATNLSAASDVPDANGVDDSFVVDLDPDGDGVHTAAMTVSRAFGFNSMDSGSHDIVISGNGSMFAALSRNVPSDPHTEEELSVDWLFRAPRTDHDAFILMSRDVRDVSIDTTGSAMAFVKDHACNDKPTVMALMVSTNIRFQVALGTIFVEDRNGEVWDPSISADGSTVAWTTTRPEFSFDGESPALEHPVVRSQRVGWWDAEGSGDAFQCSGIRAGDWVDVAEGAQASLSASGRTIAFATPDATPPAVRAVDTHSNEGLSVSSADGSIVTPGFMTSVAISDIPVSSVRDYSAAIAGAPVYRLPVYRLPVYRLPVYRLPVYRLLVEDSPVYRLPVYRLPVYRLPVYRLDLPGGWTQILEGTPYGGELVQTVTLDVVLAWAADTLADGATPTPEERAAAELIQSLTLGDVGLDDSGLDGLTIASYVLGSAPLAEIPLGGAGAPLSQWQGLLDRQGLDLPLDGETALADADAAGLDVSHSGIEAVPLRDLPIDKTLFGYLRVVTDDPSVPGHGLFLTGTPLGDLDVTTLDDAARQALFGTPDVTGTLAAPSTPILQSATVADLARGVPGDVTFGTLLLSMLDTENYPWEQIDPSSIDPSLASSSTSGQSCTGNIRCSMTASFAFTFDAGPGDPTTYLAPTASVTTPAGTTVRRAPGSDTLLVGAAGSGPGLSFSGEDLYQGPLQLDGRLVRIPLPDTRAGTVIQFTTAFTETNQPGAGRSTAELTSGGLTATEELFNDAPLSTFDDPTRNLVAGQPQVLHRITEGILYYEWISPQWMGIDDEGNPSLGPAEDADYYGVDAPAPGERLVISTNGSDGQIALSLYAPTTDSAATLGVADAGPAPGTAVTEQSGQGSPAEAGADAASELPGQTLVDQAVVRGDGAAEVEAASTAASGGDTLVLRVTSGNGNPSSSLYSLRVRYLPEPAETTCLPYAPPQVGVQGTNDPVTDATNTLYLLDTQRYGERYGAAAAESVRASLASLTGTGTVGAGTVQGAVLSVDSDPDVRAARAALDANPCSMAARGALTSAINRFVSQAIEGHRDQVASVVVVGGDDVLPFAPVAQNTAQFTEASHAGELRLLSPLAGGSCPDGVAAGAPDPCETPLSAAARGSFILSDDPYGLATAYRTAGGHLYVPSVALGRIVGDETEIAAVVSRFIDSQGVLAADSTATAGYGAWSELPEKVTSALEWRSPANETFPEEPATWTSELIESTVFPAAGQSARLVSINTHADESRMLPGVPGAHNGSFSDADLFTAGGRTGAAQLSGALVFLIGCHAGNNLPDGYYGAGAEDWVDVFSSAGGYVGNTGYGLANNTTTALSERLLALYADWIGVTVGDSTVSAAGALTYAKQSYLSGLGSYTGYDEKVLMEAVYYGLPMYSFAPAATAKSAPLPGIPDDLTDVATDGLLTASLSLNPVFTTTSATDADGRTVQVTTADGQDPLAVAGQPILPRIVSQLNTRPDGLLPRGAVITALTSVTEPYTPAIAEPGVGVPETTATRTGVAFPSTFATVTTQDTPSGLVDLLVVTPARIVAPAGGTGTIDTFTSLELDVTYGHASSTDSTAPALLSADLSGRGGVLAFRASDGEGGSGVQRMVLLVQPEGENAWQRVEVAPPAGDDGEWTAPVPPTTFRWILQVIDAEGNVTTESSRGHLTRANAPAPELSDPGEDVTVDAGTRVARALDLSGVQAGDQPTATVRVSTPDGEIVSTGPAAVVTGDDGATRIVTDPLFTTPGTFVVDVSACIGTVCDAASFGVTVRLGNRAPSTTAHLSSDHDPVDPTATLTASATGVDPDDDPDGQDNGNVGFSYVWTRNGVPLSNPGSDPRVLSLAGIAQPGDEIAVQVTPYDSQGQAGHIATASVFVTIPPPAPAITASTGTYVSGTWSRSPVTVTFECTSGVLVTTCPAPVTVSADTAAAGREVSGTMTDVLGRQATASVVVKVDRTAPVLAPTVTPDPVAQGATAVAAPNASDPLSGIASQSCDTPSTATAGTKTVACRAADVAGNVASASVAYTVKAPGARTCLGVADRQALTPYNADGSSVFLRHSGVPLVFRACDAAGRSIGTKKFVKGVVLVSSGALPAGARINELWYPPVPVFKYSKAFGLWTGTIPTAKLASGKLYTYRVLLGDGTSFTVTFGVR
ncbi:hypothetical protein ABZ477_07695 [Microbacterium sp. NPDC019599]|uniref:hypothetical protein n=1 Tax=Microbacterium sp. NPDC019599 TaxID=3154690 RepID=UPI0033EFA8D8